MLKICFQRLFLIKRCPWLIRTADIIPKTIQKSIGLLLKSAENDSKKGVETQPSFSAYFKKNHIFKKKVRKIKVSRNSQNTKNI